MNAVRRLALLVAVLGLMQASTSLGGAEDDLRLRAAGLTVGVGFVLLASLFMGRLFAVVGLPKLTGYLATGILAGPAVLGFLPGHTVSGMGLVNGVAIALIALTAGSEMDFRAMRPLLRAIAWISSVAVLGTALLLGALTFLVRSELSVLAGMPLGEALIVSAVVGVVVVAQSPAVVVAIRAETGADGPVARTVLGVVVLADLVVIVLFAVVSAICQAVLSGVANPGETAANVSWELFGSLGFGTLVGGILALWMRLVGERGLDLFVLATCLVVAEVARRVRLDPLLLMLGAGMFVENVARVGHRLRAAFEHASLPVYILFFTVAGASIELDVLPRVALPAGVLIVGRAVGLWCGTYVAAKLAGAPESVQRWGGFGLMPQAGLAIALSLLFARTFPSFGEEAGALTLGIVAVNELVAPALMRWSLVRAGESSLRASSAGQIDAPSAHLSSPGLVPAARAAEDPREPPAPKGDVTGG
jgi:Kef-type K+ transport system membrane component KefB